MAKTEFENVREEMATIADWLAQQDETMSYGLRSIDDAVKLWHAAQRSKLDLYPDERTPAWRKRALGYDPLAEGYLNASKGR